MFDLIENIGSGVLRILDAYDKSCFKFMNHFLRFSFKYKEDPFEYEEKTDKKTTKKFKEKPQEKTIPEQPKNRNQKYISK